MQMYFASIAKLLREPTPPRHVLRPNRFWDETIRVPGLFERFRHADDLPNAVACFDSMARYRYRDLTNRPDFDPKKPSVISIFQPKSGGTYLQNRMLELGYHDFWWCFSDRICASHCYAGVDALKLFMLGGCTCHIHARPEPNISRRWIALESKKSGFISRNPAESVVSAYYHYLGQGHGEGSVGEQRKNEAVAEAGRQGLAPGMDISTFVVDAITFLVGWVAEWLQFANQHQGLVVLSYFSELTDPQALFSRVFDELEIDLGGTVTVEPMRHDRFRTKRSTSWRSELSIDSCRYLEKRIRAELDGFPQFARLWT